MYVSVNQKLIIFKNASALYLSFAKEGRKELCFFLSDVSSGNVTLHRGLQVAFKLRVAQAQCMSLFSNSAPHAAKKITKN
jgi:hypothetical protein